MTADEIRQRAEQSRQILFNPLFEETFEKLKEQYTSRWENTADDEIQNRELLYNRLKALMEVRREFLKEINAEKFLKN
jgi:hypothetical protein